MRCIQDLGFVRALVNGSTQDIDLDDPSYELFWQTLNELEVPLYLHPGIPTKHPEYMMDDDKTRPGNGVFIRLCRHCV